MAATSISHFTSSVIGLFVLILTAKFELGACFTYTINEPTFQWTGFRLEIDYTFSGAIQDNELVTYEINSDRECDGGIISFSEIESQLIETSKSSVRLSLLMHPENIHMARYVTHKENFAIVGICTRIFIKRGVAKPEEDRVVVSAPRDDYVMIKAHLKDLRGIEEILEDWSKNWGMKAFQCNSNNQKIDSPPAIRNGEKVRICLKPTQRTLNDNVYISTLKSFQFERGDIVQKAVALYGTDEVTKVDCQRGSNFCVIESVLSNEFFHSPGEVEAEGVLYLQYSDENGENRRSLRAVPFDLRPETRSLYDFHRGEIVADKPAVTLVDIEPMDKVYSAEAFACDTANDKPTKKTTLKEEETLKVCIRPDEEARDEGVFINSLEDFSAGRANDDKTQPVLDSIGRPTDSNITKVECDIGDASCTIETQLKQWFYDEDESVVITGYVVLQFGAHTRRVKVVNRDLLGLGYAGRSQVDVFYNTVGRSPEQKRPFQDWFDGLFDRWELSDTHMTILYIVAAVLIVLILVCCFAGCLFLLSCRNDKKPKQEKKSVPINIKISEKGDFQDALDDGREQPRDYYDDDRYSSNRRARY